MEWFSAVRDAYREEGIDLRVGASTTYTRPGETASVTHHEGIGMIDTLMLDLWCENECPKSVLVIGNGLGWSTLVLAAMSGAHVVALDPWTDGNDFTNKLASRLGLEAVAVNGESPGDVEDAVRKWLPQVPDLVLIDAMHTDTAIAADFGAAWAVGGSGAAYFIHDAGAFKLVEGVKQIQAMVFPAMKVDLLAATPMGTAVALSTDRWQRAQRVLAVFMGV